MRALLASSDLSIVSLATHAAQRHGAQLQVAMNPAALAAACEPATGDSAAFQLVIFDLGMPALDISAAVQKLREAAVEPQPPSRTIAFGPHVQEGRLAAARSAGCDRVLSRGQFHAQIDAIFSGAG